MHFQSPRRRRDAAQDQEATLRVLRLERSAEVLPVLVEEIVALGHPRAAVLEIKGDSEEVVPVATANWSLPGLAQLIEEMRDPSGLLARVRMANPGALIQNLPPDRARSLQLMLYSSSNPCAEAAPADAESCLALKNMDLARRPPRRQQQCSVCGVWGYVMVAVVELRPDHTQTDCLALSDLVRSANQHLSRLTKVDQYRKRIGELESMLADKSVSLGARLEEEFLTGVQHLSMVQTKAQVERRMLEIEKFASAGRLAATIAHEVNNPMEAIKNAVYLLAGVIPESSLPVYNILKSETERVARVVRQMLGLYRDTEPVKPVSVNTIIEDTLLLLNRQLQRASVQVEAELGVLPDAFIAADQIRQVLSNLVINARDAMPVGGKLRIRSRHVIGRNPASSWIRILVADSGTGIPREIIGDIFEPFVTTKGGGGTGLGLWIVKGIIKNHGGKIAVRSKVGLGTVFRIDLPIAKP